MEPAIGPEGRALLRCIRLLGSRSRAADVANRPLLLELIARGHIRRFGPAHAFLTLTPKGNLHLDQMMRCE